MPTEVILTAGHIDIFKKARFFAGWKGSSQAYLEGDIGWLKPGLRLLFVESVVMEPYSAIYSGQYVSSAGQRNSHGLCSIGSCSYSNSPLPDRTSVGRHCSISNRLRMLDSQHPVDRVTSGHLSWKRNAFIGLSFEDAAKDRPKATKFDLLGKPYPKIAHDVWIGQDVVIAGGVTIHTGAIVAANSMVTKDVPPYAIVGGNPARIIRYRFAPELIDRMLASEWWAYDWRDFADISMDDVPAFLDAFEKRKPELIRYEPRGLRLPEDLLA